MKRFALALSVGLIGLSTAWAMKPVEDKKGESSDTKIMLADAPKAVQKTIEKEAGAAIKEVAKETEEGFTVYEVSWKVGDVKHEVNVNEAGDVLETEMAVSGKDVPKAVRAAAMKHMSRGAKPGFEKKMVVLYEIEAVVDGTEVELLVDPNGRVVELEADDDEGHEVHGDDDDDDDDDD